jgi:DNA-binding NarL/FixJ family response regulator
MKLLLVDDHPLYGVGFAHALGAAEPGMQVLNASSLEEGLALAAAHPELDAVLVDYHLGALNGIEGLRRFGQQHPQVARVLISGDNTGGAAPQPTVRQLEVLALLAHGQPNKRIASMLGIAERTVKLHITALLTLMGARNRTQLLVVARERGLV